MSNLNCEDLNPAFAAYLIHKGKEFHDFITALNKRAKDKGTLFANWYEGGKTPRVQSINILDDLVIDWPIAGYILIPQEVVDQVEEWDRIYRIGLEVAEAESLGLLGSALRKALNERGLLVGSGSDTPIEELQLGVRAYTALKGAGYDTVEQILAAGEDEILGERSFGRKSFDELHDRLVACGFIEDKDGFIPVEKSLAVNAAENDSGGV